MKRVFLAVFILALLHCAAYGADAGPRFLWREDSGIPLSDVATPKGFTLSPEQAVTPILDRMSRAPYFVAYLFADSTLYYFWLADMRADFPSSPPTTAITINGVTGETTFPEYKSH